MTDHPNPAAVLDLTHPSNAKCPVSIMLLAVALISLTLWLYLTAARGTFWRLGDFDDDTAHHQPPSSWPRVIAIIPARNEAESIHQSLASLLQQNYPGQFHIILIDDHSEDATTQIARQTAQSLNAGSRFTLLSASPLPANWTGKLWALNEGVIHANANALTTRTGAAPLRPSSATTESSTPTYLWFTDADITHAPDTLQRLVSRAEKNHLDLTSLMVQLQAKTLPERALIPAFLFFFLKLYPPNWIADPNASTAGAAGGCILLRTEALQKIGGLAAIRGEVIDDCALARAVKVAQPLLAVLRRSPSSNPQPTSPDQQLPPEAQSAPQSKPRNASPPQSHQSGQNPSGRLWMGLTRQSTSLRASTTFHEIRDMIARTAYTQLRYNPLLLLGTVAAMALIYLAPVALLFSHNTATRILAAATCLLMFLLYVPTIRFYRLSSLWAATLPAAALFYTYATLLSAIRYHQGRGAQWKGRSQIPRQP